MIDKRFDRCSTLSLFPLAVVHQWMIEYTYTGVRSVPTLLMVTRNALICAARFAAPVLV